MDTPVQQQIPPLPQQPVPEIPTKQPNSSFLTGKGFLIFLLIGSIGFGVRIFLLGSNNSQQSQQSKIRTTVAPTSAVVSPVVTLVQPFSGAISPAVTPGVTIVPSTLKIDDPQMVSCTKDKDCMLADENYTSTAPQCCLSFAYTGTVAFNAAWYIQYKNTHPVEKKVCSVMCLNYPDQDKYFAQCIHNICQKVFRP